MIRFAQTLLRRSSWVVAFFQAGLIFSALLLAWLFRFDFTLPYRNVLLASIPVLLAVRLIAIRQFNLLHGWWRYTGISDTLDVVKAVVSGSAIFVVILRYILGVRGFPRSIYVMEPLLTAGLLIGIRMFSRVLAESVRADHDACRRVLIIGAGAGAQIILREIRRPGTDMVALGCLDDDPSKLSIRVHDVPVLGTVDQLPEVLASTSADEVLIAVPSATGKQMQRFVQICTQSKIPCRTLPALKDIIAGEVTVGLLREVSLEDLLGREPVRIDLASVDREIAGRVVMVTGAAGSVGSELCRQILDYGPKNLICLDQSETGLFYLRIELQMRENGRAASFCVADVANREGLAHMLATMRPQVIFHAAAYKHVPMMEQNVQEAVRNNVLGLNSFLNVVEHTGCETFVLISSDKAVNPTNIMGATKRIGELIISSRPTNNMRCVSVRFGNVLGSSGSVVPVLKQQLRDRQPLTVTHPDMKRFFMTTREAIALVLQAFTLGQHGDILVLDMGEPVRILDLARNLVRLSGRSHEEIEVLFTGLREGEKLEEELFYADEEILDTRCDKIKRIVGSSRNWPDLQRLLEELRMSLTLDGVNPIRAKIKEIVPQYFHPDNIAVRGQGAHPFRQHLDRAVGQD
jgi:FlaA1/EpsC-like NDP-sugar epimerase